jgi:DNA-binding IscR family transcriptional regulator
MARQARAGVVLAHIRTLDGPFTIAELAAVLDIPSNSVSSVCVRAARDGLLERYPGTRGAYIRVRQGAVPGRKLISVGTLLECVGHTEAGDAVLKDESSITYIAKVIR